MSVMKDYFMSDFCRLVEDSGGLTLIYKSRAYIIIERDCIIHIADAYMNDIISIYGCYSVYDAKSYNNLCLMLCHAVDLGVAGVRTADILTVLYTMPQAKLNIYRMNKTAIEQAVYLNNILNAYNGIYHFYDDKFGLRSSVRNICISEQSIINHYVLIDNNSKLTEVTYDFDRHIGNVLKHYGVRI